jgi:hypothetical protein
MSYPKTARNIFNAQVVSSNHASSEDGLVYGGRNSIPTHPVTEVLGSGETIAVQASANSAEDMSLTKLREKKILHAPMEIAGNMAKICKFLRKNKIHATSVNYYDTWLKYNCDINLHVHQYSPDKQKIVIDNFAKKAIEEYDIYHFHFGQTLYPDYRDLPELVRRNKKIIINFWGSDARAPEWILYHQAKFLGYDPPKPFFNTINQYVLLKHLNKFADVMLAASGVPRGMRLRGQIDATLWPLEEKDNIVQNTLFKKDPKKTYFVHAPTDNWKKGSRLILPVLERLQKKGLPIQVLYVQKLTLDEAKKIYALADYAVDQVGVGAVGLFGMEMMCWKIPVLTYQIPLFSKVKNHPPVINITADNFEEKVIECVENKANGKLYEQGEYARKWVLDNEDINATFCDYLDMYKHLANNEPVKQFINKAWYVQEEKILNGKKSEFFQYMIKSGACKELNIHVDGYDKRLYL